MASLNKAGKTPPELNNLVGFIDVLIQIDLGQRAKSKQIENTTK